MRRRRFLIGGGKRLDYLTFTAGQSGTFTLTIPASVTTSYLTSVSYSVDGGAWVTTSNTDSKVVITTPTVAAGGNVRWKGTGTKYNMGSAASKFSSTGNYFVSGNIMSLLYGDSFDGKETLSSYCFAGLFSGSSKLTSAEDLVLPAKVMEPYCYNSLFYNCTSMTAAPELPATEMAERCYEVMFSACPITTAPELPADTLAPYCYKHMFQNCTSLVNAPELDALTLAEGCYRSMFYNCTSLVVAPELPAMTLVPYCYEYMFEDCSSLAYTPDLPALVLEDYCYHGMFRKCSSVDYIYIMAPSLNGVDPIYGMTYGISPTGTIVMNPDATWSHDISGWATRAPYLTFKAKEAGTFSLSIPASVTTTHVPSVSYSLDDGATWTTVNNSSSAVTVTTPSVTVGKRVMWKATANSFATGETIYSKFSATGNFTVSGNIMSLEYGDSFAGQTSLKNYNYSFFRLFVNNTKLISARSLMMPATTLRQYCYDDMFEGCKNLKFAPSILPATTLQSHCYSSMFRGCTSLVASPELPATTLVQDCYYYMFFNCGSLRRVTSLATSVSASAYTTGWLDGVAASGIFIKNESMSGWSTGRSGIPSGWTVVSEFTTLAYSKTFAKDELVSIGDVVYRCTSATSNPPYSFVFQDNKVLYTKVNNALMVSSKTLNTSYWEKV